MARKIKNPEPAQIIINLSAEQEAKLISRAKAMRQSPQKLISRYFDALMDDELIEDMAMVKLLKEVDWSKRVPEEDVMKALHR